MTAKEESFSTGAGSGSRIEDSSATAPIDGSTSLHGKTVITLGDSSSTSTMLPTKTTITLEALLTRSSWILTSNTLRRHVNDDEKFDCFDNVAIVAQC